MSSPDSALENQIILDSFTHDIMLSSSEYLGNENISARFEWMPGQDGRSYLVRKEDLDTLQELAERAAADPETQTVRWAAPDPVVLSAIVRISPDKFRFVPCGWWKGPRRLAMTFEDVKLTCLGVTPSHPVWAKEDFKNAMDNLGDITAKKFPNGTGRVAIERLPFRYKLFDRLDVPASNRYPRAGECRFCFAL